MTLFIIVAFMPTAGYAFSMGTGFISVSPAAVRPITHILSLNSLKSISGVWPFNGFFSKVDAKTPEEAMQTAETWLEAKRAELEKVLGVGIGIEVVEAVGDED